MKKVLLIGLIVLISFALIYLFFNFSSNQGTLYGEAIPADLTVTSISEVLQDGGQSTEESVIEGVITTECPTGCWFFLRDETGQIYVNLSPSFTAIPQKVGATVKVKGKLQVTEHGTQFIGTGVIVK